MVRKKENSSNIIGINHDTMKEKRVPIVSMVRVALPVGPMYLPRGVLSFKSLNSGRPKTLIYKAISAYATTPCIRNRM